MGYNQEEKKKLNILMIDMVRMLYPHNRTYSTVAFVTASLKFRNKYPFWEPINLYINVTGKQIPQKLKFK